MNLLRLHSTKQQGIEITTCRTTYRGSWAGLQCCIKLELHD